MADHGKSEDFDRLLDEVDALEGKTGRSRPAAKRRPAAPEPEPSGGGQLRGVIRTSALTGGVAAGVVFVLFAFLPFLGAFSGAAGAFVATFVIALVLRATGRR